MKIQAVKCKNCGDIVYSRALHDLHGCSCGYVAVDGGFDYVRIIFRNTDGFESIEIEVDATKQELYNDWNCSINKYGLIKGD